VFGFGAGGGGIAEPTLVADLFGMKSHGSIFGAVSFSFTVGGAIGPLITGHLFDISGNYQTAFMVSGTIGVCGLILTLLLKPVRKRDTQTVAM
jgi:MFS family permease